MLLSLDHIPKIPSRLNFSNHLTSIAAYVNGKSIPANLIVLNFQNGSFLYGYRSIFTTTGKINRDEGIGITRNEYKGGFSLFGFDLSPTLIHIKNLKEVEI